MSDCRFGVSPVNYPDPDPDQCMLKSNFIVYRAPYIILVRVAVLLKGAIKSL